MNPILPMNTTQQSFDDNATLRKLRMDALQVCFLSKKNNQNTGLFPIII